LTSHDGIKRELRASGKSLQIDAELLKESGIAGLDERLEVEERNFAVLLNIGMIFQVDSNCREVLLHS
jgi:hypothetical protein